MKVVITPAFPLLSNEDMLQWNDMLMELKEEGNILKIVSHKTKYPIKGERYDLHKGALEWLSKNKFFNKNGPMVCIIS